VLDPSQWAVQTASPELRSFRVTEDFLSAVRTGRLILEQPPRNPDGAAVLMITLGALTILIRRARLDKTIDLRA